MSTVRDLQATTRKNCGLLFAEMDVDHAGTVQLDTYAEHSGVPRDLDCFPSCLVDRIRSPPPKHV